MTKDQGRRVGTAPDDGRRPDGIERRRAPFRRSMGGSSLPTRRVRALALCAAQAIGAAALLLATSAGASAADCRASPEPKRDWSGCNRSNIVLSGENLAEADLHETNLSTSDLRQATLKGANLEGAKLARASLAGAVADGANFTDVEGYRTDLSNVSATNASFRGAELQRSSFANAALQGASFEKAELGRVEFAGAHLGNGVFKFANLARASFKTAAIEGALDFTGAYMFLTRIEGADLSQATGLSQAQVDLTCGDADTKLPSGLAPPASWPCRFD